MKYTKGTNYALHIMAYMVRQNGNETISLQPLAKHFEMPPTYLSKVLTQLVKADLIQSAPGVKGGYSLRKKKEDITFFDVVRAIEGSGALFTCEMNEAECHLQKVMREAEYQLESYLKSKTLYDVIKSTDHNHEPHEGSVQNFVNKIEFLDSVMRKSILPPEEILNTLPILKNSSILDVGAGSGYLTIPAAKLTEGNVIALDMDARMLEVIETKAEAEAITNIQMLQGSVSRVPLPDSSIDIVLASLILHEVRPLPAVLSDMYRILKPGGCFLCVEYEKTESPAKGPPMHIRIPSSEMKQELERAGFSIQKHLIRGEATYIITAQKP